LERRLPEEATRHSLYGFSGWLLAAYGLAIASFLVWVGFSVYAVVEGVDSRTVPGAVRTTLGLLALLQALFVLPFLVLAPLRHHAMPSVVTVCVWFGVALNLLYAPPLGAVSHVVWAALFTAYLLRSKRVNVTYRHRVPA
jgi:hypothetical protein